MSASGSETTRKCTYGMVALAPIMSVGMPEAKVMSAPEFAPMATVMM